MRRRDAALAKVEEHAGDGWMEDALDAIYGYALAHETLSADELWAVLPPCREQRAVGSAMLAAKRAGFIEPTGAFRPSVLASSHACPRRVWRSKIWVGR